jgi:2-aminoadipate transaminase
MAWMELIDFSRDEPDASLLPVDEIADCAATVLGRDGKTILSYGSGAGYTPLRELIGQWFEIHPYNVVLTNGWLQGLELLSSGLVNRRGVAVQYPSDERALRLLLRNEASMIYISSDGDGLLTSELEQQLIQYVRPALIYVTPSFSNPTGHTMPEHRRRHLIELLGNYNRLGTEEMLLLEDDSFALTRFEGERLPALFDISAGQTMYTSSFSPTVAPGLRVGWLLLPDRHVDGVTRKANSTYITPALLGQATVFEFIRRGSFEPHLLWLRERLRERRDALLAALAEHLPDATWSRPEGGYFVWLELPETIDARAVLARAKGVTAVAGTEFGVTSSFVRLSYSSVSAADIAEGVERLARAVAEELELHVAGASEEG